MGKPEITAIAPWFGSKRTLAPEIVRQLGPHRAYWEPFCGSMAVLLAKERATYESVNDLHGDLINLASAERLRLAQPAGDPVEAYHNGWATGVHLRAAERCDESMRDYVRRVVCGPGVPVAAVPRWLILQGVGHALVGKVEEFDATICNTLANYGHTVPYLPRRICRACRQALLTARLKPHA